MKFIHKQRSIAYDFIVRRRDKNVQQLKILDAEIFLETRGYRN